MSQSTQAHLDRTISKNLSLEDKKQALSKMQYYMGAKLIEVGIDPQSVVYRWSVNALEDKQICTLSAYWGDSKARLLSGEEPLTGDDLVSCARGNAATGVAKTAQLCGYAKDIDRFQSVLKQTMTEMGLENKSLNNLLN